MLVIKRETFNIEFANIPSFKEGDILSSSQGNLFVLKTYPLNWYRKFLKWLGFKTKEKQIKVCKN